MLLIFSTKSPTLISTDIPTKTKDEFLRKIFRLLLYRSVRWGAEISDFLKKKRLFRACGAVLEKKVVNEQIIKSTFKLTQIPH